MTDLQSVQTGDAAGMGGDGTPGILISATVGLDFDGPVGTIDIDGTTYTVTIKVTS